MINHAISSKNSTETHEETRRGRALFVDFDGVLHPSTVIQGLDTTLPLDVLSEKNGLFRWTHHLAELLTGHEDVMVFAHSSWRFTLSNSAMRQALGPLGIFFEGVTNPQQRQRMASIEETVQRADLGDYLVLDDARDEFTPGFEHLVLCNPLQGVAAKDVQLAVRSWLERTHQETDLLSAVA